MLLDRRTRAAARQAHSSVISSRKHLLIMPGDMLLLTDVITTDAQRGSSAVVGDGERAKQRRPWYMTNRMVELAWVSRFKMCSGMPCSIQPARRTWRIACGW